MAGVVIVGIASQQESSGGGEDTKPMGIILILVAQCFVGVQFIVEEKLLGGYYLDPMKVVGLEGMWGTLYYCTLLPIFQHIPCTNPDLCVPPVIEDSKEAFSVLFSNTPSGRFCLAMAIGTIFSIAFFNVLGVSITKYASAAQRPTVDSTRTLLIWVIQMMMGKEDWNWIEAAGFVVLVFGTLTYNEIIVWPCALMNANTKEKVAERENKGLLDGSQADPRNSMRRSMAKDQEYINTSPGALYDYNRNRRALDQQLNDREQLIQRH